ncbi:type II toxin-antitoxin system HipA family toxin YjjJ [Chitinimonas naiadis]
MTKALQIADQLTLALQGGALSAEALVGQLNVSYPTLVKAIQLRGEQIRAVGKTKGRRFALVDPIPGVEVDVPVFRVDQQGHPVMIAHLTPLAAAQFLWRPADGAAETISDGLPYQLYDFRPQGFLGRAWTRAHAEIGLNADVSSWTDRDVIFAAAKRGEDLPGHYIIGSTTSMRLALLNQRRLRHAIPAVARLARYGEMAEQALESDEAPGSSVGGEQPKFTAHVDDGAGSYSVIVKFSGRLDNPVSQRWSDLLRAEHHALETLGRSGFPAAKTSVLNDGNRTYLEVRRFDRVGRLGRVGLVSLKSFTEPAGMVPMSWEQAVPALIAQKVLRPDTRQATALLVAFSILIGNGDRHHGNLSIVEEGAMPWELAPAYDILPMHYAPRASGEIRSEGLVLLPPDASGVAARRQMMAPALAFWEAVRADTEITAPFRTLAEINLDAVRAHQRLLGAA